MGRSSFSCFLPYPHVFLFRSLGMLCAVFGCSLLLPCKQMVRRVFPFLFSRYSSFSSPRFGFPFFFLRSGSIIRSPVSFAICVGPTTANLFLLCSVCFGSFLGQHNRVELSEAITQRVAGGSYSTERDYFAKPFLSKSGAHIFAMCSPFVSFVLWRVAPYFSLRVTFFDLPWLLRVIFLFCHSVPFL